MSARQPKSAKVRNLKAQSVDAAKAKSVKGGIALLLPAVQKVREAAARMK